ncbi:MAG: hypothetical protein HMLIMOIP_000724 [Candidatus Nitrosomirales archaeon]|jgi:hypothetical protein
MSEKRQDKDAFDIYQETCGHVIDEVAKLQPAYTQSVTNLQQEYTEAFKRITEANISVQKEFANTTWGPGKFPAAMARNAGELAEAFLKAAVINNKAVIAGIDAARQNIKTFNDNVETFAKINLNLIKTWQSFVVPIRQ